MSDHESVTSAPAPHRDWRLVGLVAVGGAFGSVLRYVIGLALPTPGWPWATFTVNLAGSFALGWLLEGLAARGPEDSRQRRIRLFVGTGALGGFTTYSSFALELDRLLAQGHAPLALAYAAATLVLGMLAALAGVVVGRRRSTGSTARPPRGRPR
jgi:CrcB protein